jgi:hypothetical protein
MLAFPGLRYVNLDAMVCSEACRSSTAYRYESSRLYSLRTNKVQLKAALRHAVDRVGCSDYSRRRPRGHRAGVRARQRSYLCTKTTLTSPHTVGAIPVLLGCRASPYEH